MTQKKREVLRDLLLNPVMQEAMDEVLAETPISGIDPLSPHNRDMMTDASLMTAGYLAAFNKLLSKGRLPRRSIHPKMKRLRPED